MRLTRPFVFAASLLCAGGYACSLVSNYDGYTAADAPPRCGKRLPARPGTGPSGGSDTRYGAASALRFVDEDETKPLGFDLDGLCTCPDRGTCLNKNEGTKGPCDPTDGIDNAAGNVVRLLFHGSPEADRPVEDGLANGTHGMLVQVQGWNGEPDDADVTVALYNVVGVKGGTARFDGNDELVVANESLLDPGSVSPRYYDTGAYVSGGVLVAAIDFDLRLVVTGVDDMPADVAIPLRAARFVGQIRQVGAAGIEMLDAQLVGRMPDENIFDQLSRIGLCHDGGLYPNIKQNLCGAFDVPSNPVSDGTDIPCNAISFAVGIEVKPAKLGGNAPTASLPKPCGEEPLDRCP